MKEKLSMLDALSDRPEKIIFQIGSLNLEETLQMAEKGKKAGVKALAAFPPYYYPNIPDEFLEKYYLKISSVYETFVYNFPLATGREVSASLVRRVNQAGGNITGIKDTVNDPAHMLDFKLEFGKDFTVFSGPDFLIMNAARIGLDGIVASSTNYVPEVVSSMLGMEDVERMTGLQSKINRLVKLARRYGQLSSGYALVEALQGYSMGDPREPIFPLSAEQKKEITEEARMIAGEL